MPEVDHEAGASACADNDPTDGADTCQAENVPPDLPPDSFWLSKDAEFDWFDRNAFFERKDSAKASSASDLHPAHSSTPSSNAQRSSSHFKSKSSIIGLPKPHDSRFVIDAKKNHRRTGNATRSPWSFPKRLGSIGNKSDSSAIEPSSPKVSCMGRVRSKKDANRRKRREELAGARRTGPLESFLAMFRSGCQKEGAVLAEVADPESRPVSAKHRPRSTTEPLHPSPASGADVQAGDGGAAGLEGMKRFASGRRSETWGNVA